jgi:molybdenum cofactor biosynthesis enzyme MoaA
VAVPHLREAPRAVVSFGQGCEGEPLLQAETLARSIRMMRECTPRGTINLNTNGSLPRRVKELCDAGLNSIRVSMNSAQQNFYQAYFNPRGYTFEDIKLSLKTVKSYGRFASINYFVLPGFTDTPPEFEALCSLIQETQLDLIQMRNLNIDPEWYRNHLKLPPPEKTIGIRQLMRRLNERFPELKFGYFNPCVDESLVS